jgi:hypothetical protein
MQVHRLIRATRVLGASTLALLVLAVPAGARTADNVTPQTTAHSVEAPWARALRIRSEAMNQRYHLGHATSHDHDPGAAPGSITFTNPLGRSRGPGTGAGLR